MPPPKQLRMVMRVSLLLLLVPLVCANPAQGGDAHKGQALYASRCAFCHGVSGRGDGPAGAALKPSPTNFTSPDFWKNTKPETIKASVENGKPNTAMIGFKATLSPEQIDDLLAYLQTLKPSQ